jgi:hypothetical protein
MTTTSHRRDIHAQIGNTRDVLAQADAEGRALRGEFGAERQILAMSEQYKRLRSAGRMEEAAAVKAEAYRIHQAQQ